MTPDDVRRVAKCVAAIQGLPGVATTDWCERASEVLALLRPDARVGVAIGSFPRDAGPNRVELSHLHHPEARRVGRVRRTLEGRGLQRRIGGLLDRLAEGAETVSLGVRWPTVQIGSPWDELGVNELVLGLGRLDQRRASRLLVVEMGAEGASSRDPEVDAAVLGAVMGVLLTRCRMRLVPGPVDASRRVTPSEQIILEQLVLGRSVREIAEALGRSPHTVHDHVKSLHRKLRARSRGELIARALGHLSPEDVQREREALEPAPRAYAAGA